MKIETRKFKTALDVVKPALSIKEIIEQSTSFAFVDNKVVTYNDEICISQELDNVKINGVVKAEELYKFIAKVNDKEFDLSITDNEVVMKAGHAKVGFALNKAIVLPLNEDVSTKSEFSVLPENFLQACKFAAEAASTDMTNPKLTCVHITHDGVIEACNNHRLVVWNLKEQLQTATMLVPAKSIKEVIKLAPTRVATGKGWVHFKNDTGAVISCRTFEETYVDTQGVINRIGKSTRIEFPDGLLSVLEKAELFSQEQKLNASITIEIKSGKLLVKSESETAWFKETIAFDGVAEFTFIITSYLLKDILKQTNECFISKNILKFQGDQWIYITSLRETSIKE